LIAVQLEGRLGNQLFQYAFAYAASKKLGVSFYLDKSIEPILLYQYFEVKTDVFYLFDKYLFSIKGFKSLFTLHLRKGFYKSVRCFLNLSKIDIGDTDIELNKIRNHSVIHGFFQSTAYFEPFEKEVLAFFKIKDTCRYEFEKIYNALPQDRKLIVVHVRRTDYIGLSMALPLSYFEKAIALYDQIQYYYVFVSDDPLFIEKHFSYIENKYVSTHSEIIDLQFLMNADICILSNSSFSWWGAYLNKKAVKIIVPKFWSGFRRKTEEPYGIIRDEWTLLDV